MLEQWQAATSELIDRKQAGQGGTVKWDCLNLDWLQIPGQGEPFSKLEHYPLPPPERSDPQFPRGGFLNVEPCFLCRPVHWWGKSRRWNQNGHFSPVGNPVLSSSIAWMSVASWHSFEPWSFITCPPGISIFPSHLRVAAGPALNMVSHTRKTTTAQLEKDS